VSVREALLNAVAHRDYRLGGSVFVRQYGRRLEITSPGGLPAGVTPENILDQQNPRNRRLAEALGRCGLIERSGQGINLMFEGAIRQSKPLPSFAGTSDYEVRLTLDGTVTTPAFVRFLERLGEERLRSFSTYDFLALDYLRRNEPLPDHLKARLPGLVDAGAVESVGRGRGTRYVLARNLYAALGERGVYTRKKGLDRETNKALLLRHIEANAERGARMEEFRQVLPALGRSQIQVLLRELRKEKAIHLIGHTRAARWFPGAGPSDCNREGAEE
jgi:ATP-dependent DNA helicase RecG